MLDMGKPVPILEVAETMIRMAGKSPYTDIPIRFTGIRPGEKLHETLHGENEEVVKLDIAKIFGLRSDVVQWRRIEAALPALLAATHDHDKAAALDVPARVLPGGTRDWWPARRGDAQSGRTGRLVLCRARNWPLKFARTPAIEWSEL
ncbi:polysaccharide biosynthesis protein [Mesorhizobium atlanticum]